MLYEVLPIAFLVEQAGGMATNGKEMVMDLKPSSIHAKCPAILGSREDVEEFMNFVKKHEQ